MNIDISRCACTFDTVEDLTAAVAALGTGLGLASFGANHDTAMGLAYQGREAGLPLDLKDELESELERDRDGVLALRPTPTIAKIIPLIALGIQTFVAIRVLGLGL